MSAKVSASEPDFRNAIEVRTTAYSPITLLLGWDEAPISYYSYSLPSGNYKLVQDIDIARSIVIEKGAVVNLDLNGYELDLNGSSIKVEGELSLYGQGHVFSATSEVIKVSGTFNLYGGESSE